MKWSNRVKRLPLEFCERCRSIYDVDCRRRAIVDGALDKALLDRGGLT
jgi:hypothetical protein